MAKNDLSHVTSTPEEYCRFERSLLTSSLTEDSGYHSNFSGYVSSTNTSCLNHSKTPEVHYDEISKISNVTKDPKRTFLRQHFSIPSPRLNLTGQRYVDFFYYLGDWFHHTIIVKKILSHLSDEDLYNSAMVSKSWRHAITSIPSEEKRLRSYIKKIELTKENRNTNSAEKKLLPFECVRYYTAQTPRNKLGQIQNIQTSSVSSDSPSPTTKYSGRFEVYQKEARKMKVGKRLFCCPKCQLPSHVDTKIPSTAECTNATCKYRFCIVCECEEHLHRSCNFISTPIARKPSENIGTAKSRRNLKRLLK